MLFFSDAAEINFLKMEDKFNFLEFINTPRHRVGDTSLTYRQIYLLSKDGLLDAQENLGKWRKFSFNELVFLLVAQELKQNGFANKQLVPLYRVFIRSEKGREMIVRKDGISEPRGSAAKAIAYAFLGIPVILKYSCDGDVDFYDPVSFALLNGMSGRSFTCINIHDLVNELLRKLGSTATIDFDPMLKESISTLLNGDKITKGERDVLEAMRSGDFERLEIILKNGDVATLHGTKRQRGDLTPRDIATAIEAHAYQKVTVFVQNGKVVTCESEISQKV